MEDAADLPTLEDVWAAEHEGEADPPTWPPEGLHSLAELLPELKVWE